MDKNIDTVEYKEELNGDYYMCSTSNKSKNKVCLSVLGHKSTHDNLKPVIFVYI